MTLTRRGKCRCGKVLTFRYGPDGLKRRCARCGSIVRLRLAPGEVPPDVNATEKKLPVWTYSATEEMKPVASEIQVDWSSSEGPLLPPPPPKSAGTEDREVLDAVAADDWVALEEAVPRPKRGYGLVLGLALAGLLVGGIGAFVFFVRGE